MGNAMGFGLDYGFKQPFMGNFQGKNWRFRRFFQRNSKIGNINHPPVGMYHLDWTYQKWGIGTLIVSFIKWSSNWKYQSLSKNQGCAELVHFRCSWKFDINLHMWKGLCNLQEQSVRFPGWLFGGPGGLKHFVFIAIFRMLIIWLRFCYWMGLKPPIKWLDHVGSGCKWGVCRSCLLIDLCSQVFDVAFSPSVTFMKALWPQSWSGDSSLAGAFCEVMILKCPKNEMVRGVLSWGDITNQYFLVDMRILVGLKPIVSP